MANPTLLNVAQVQGNTKNVVYTQDLAKKSGLLKTMWWQKANGGLKHYYQKAINLPMGEFRPVNAGINVTDVECETGSLDLLGFEAMHQADRDIVDKYPGGLEQYIADKAPGYMYGLGQNFTRQMLYGTANDKGGFEGLRQLAFKNNKVIPTFETATGTGFTSIYAVRWGLDELSGLYDETAMQESLIKIEKLNKGEWFYKSVNYKEYPVYQFSFHGYFGLQSLTPSNVACLYGIKDEDNHHPSPDDIDQLLDLVFAETDGSTFLYMNREAKRLLSRLKNEKLQLLSYANDYGTQLDTWNGIPLILEDNISHTENFGL